MLCNPTLQVVCDPVYSVRLLFDMMYTQYCRMPDHTASLTRERIDSPP
jgi:hypothetical protein